MQFLRKWGWISFVCIVLSCLAGILALNQVESLMAKTAQSYILSSPLQDDAHHVVHEFSRIFCSSIRHSSCSVGVFDPMGTRLASVPTILDSAQNKIPGLFHLKVPQTQFSPPLITELGYGPAWPYLMVWILFSLSLITVPLLFFLLRAKSREKTMLLEKTQVQLELSKAEAAMGETIGILAHDIRSPLSALKIISENLSHPSTQASPQANHDMNKLLQMAVHKIETLIDELLSKYRQRVTLPSSQNPSAGEVKTHLPQLVWQIVEEAKVKFRDRVTIEFDSAEDAGSLFSAVESQVLSRLLANLINNGAEAIEEKGRISVSLRKNGPSAEIRIQDTGKGMIQAELAKIGKKGYSFGKITGTGLGIYSARKALQKCGGTLKISSEVNKGTEVLVTIPCNP